MPWVRGEAREAMRKVSPWVRMCFRMDWVKKLPPSLRRGQER